MKDTLQFAALIGDKLIRDTPFAYRLELARNHGVFDRMQFVDFGRTFGLGRSAVAYAWTQFTAPAAMALTVEIEHSDACQIWLNGREVYTRAGERRINLRVDERSLEMSFAFFSSCSRGRTRCSSSPKRAAANGGCISSHPVPRARWSAVQCIRKSDCAA